jgi:hypothetical protein
MSQLETTENNFRFPLKKTLNQVVKVWDIKSTTTEEGDSASFVFFVIVMSAVVKLPKVEDTVFIQAYLFCNILNLQLRHLLILKEGVKPTKLPTEAGRCRLSKIQGRCHRIEGYF